MSEFNGPYIADAINYNNLMDAVVYEHGADRYIAQLSAGILKWDPVALTWGAITTGDLGTGTVAYSRVGSSPTKIRVLVSQGAGNYAIVELEMSNDSVSTIQTFNYIVAGRSINGYDYDPVGNRDILYLSKAEGGGKFSVYFRYYQSGVWTGDIWLSDNVPVNQDADFARSAVDPNGKVHIVYENEIAFPNVAWWYRQIRADNTLTPAILIDNRASVNFEQYAQPGTMAFLGTHVVIPQNEENALDPHYPCTAIWDGTDYTTENPVFSTVILSTNTNDGEPPGAFLGAGGKVYISWIDAWDPLTSTSLQAMVYCSWDGATVGARLVAHNENVYPTTAVTGVPPMGQFLHSIGPIVQFSDLSFGLVCALEYQPPIGNQACTTFYWFSNTPVARVACSITITAPAAVQIRPRVAGSRRLVIFEPNAYDDCLRGDAVLQRRVNWGQRICCVPDRYDRAALLKFPADAKPFRVIDSVSTPLPSDGDVLVVSYLPPIGYDGLLNGIFHHYTGPGFRDGGGDIEWRLKFGPVYGQQMGRILVQMGQVEKFYSLKDGIPLLSHRPLQYLVYAPNGSGGILPVNSRIVCGLQGWIFPRK